MKPKYANVLYKINDLIQVVLANIHSKQYKKNGESCNILIIKEIMTIDL